MKTRWTDDSDRILEQASEMKHYNRWIVSNFEPYFGETILEIGSGQGALSKLLPSKSIVILSDIYPAYIKHLKKIFTNSVLNLDISTNLPDDLMGKMNTIFSSNVFEHIEKDEIAFMNCYRLLEVGGHLCLLVPARPEIFGRLDSEMGHYRRYRKQELMSKVKNAGFEILECRYSNLLGYFLWWGRGKLLSSLVNKGSGSSRLDQLFANFYDTFIVPTLFLEKYLHPPFGQSLVLIAKKN